MNKNNLINTTESQICSTRVDKKKTQARAADKLTELSRKEFNSISYSEARHFFVASDVPR